MSEAAENTPPDVRADSVRFLCKPGERVGRLSIVVGGVHSLIPCEIERAVFFAHDVLDAMTKSAPHK